MSDKIVEKHLRNCFTSTALVAVVVGWTRILWYLGIGGNFEVVMCAVLTALLITQWLCFGLWLHTKKQYRQTLERYENSKGAPQTDGKII